MTIFRTNTTVGLTIEPDNAGNIVFIANNNPVMRLEPSGIVDFSQARLVIPVGNIATRPSVARVGMLRFNNQANAFERFTGTSWDGPNEFTLEYLVVAGGGGGSPGPSGYQGGGGGGGGVLTGNLTLYTKLDTSFTCNVGAGGAAGANGSPSSFHTISTIGGGRGAPGSSVSNAYTFPAIQDGHPGGSGGGGGTVNNNFPGFTAGGPGTSGQGYPGGGGTFRNGSSPFLNAGGGGGASQAGGNATNTVAGKGGDGVPSLITGANVIYGGGGGGGTFAGTAGAAGAGGGGVGGRFSATSSPATNGTDNLGGGGGGHSTGAAGGSGVVILAHANTTPNAVISAGLTFTRSASSRIGYIVYTITAGTGTVTWN